MQSDWLRRMAIIRYAGAWIERTISTFSRDIAREVSLRRDVRARAAKCFAPFPFTALLAPIAVALDQR